MLIKYAYKDVEWIDVSNPSREELRELADTYGLVPSVADELLSPTPRPYFESHPDYFYLVLHFPALRHSHSDTTSQEIDFVVGTHFILTIRYDVVDPLHKFAKVFEVNSILDKHKYTVSGGQIFALMLSKLYHSLLHEIAYINDELKAIEEGIFMSKEREMVLEISKVNRNLLLIEHTLSLHADIMIVLMNETTKMFNDSYHIVMKESVREYEHVRHALMNARELLAELRTTNDSLLYAKQNEVMKTLTIMAFVTFPLTLLAGIFGMNTAYTPLVGRSYDFWIVIGIMLALTVLFFSFFKYRKWL